MLFEARIIPKQASNMRDFALIGASGYIAPRHMQAIKATGGNLVAALDPNDSVGILDSHFPECHFFVEFERFDRHIDKLRRAGEGVNYVSIASPNYLHDAHIRFALRSGAHAICEKPLVLNPWNLEPLLEFEQEFGKKVYTILQLRLHPTIIALKQRIDAAPASQRYAIRLDYITSRGRWYDVSWKGDQSKSGGIATNIGIHFFDMLLWVFGGCESLQLTELSERRASGHLKLSKADVIWNLSLESSDLPKSAKNSGQRTYRSLTIDGEELEFSSGFTDLHTQSYEAILSGNGFGITDARASIQLVHEIRSGQQQA